MRKPLLALVLGLMLLGSGLVSAQETPSGGDFPLPVGDTSIVNKSLPPPRAVVPGEVYLRGEILPPNTPDAPVRVLLAKPVDLAKLQANPDKLHVAASGLSGSIAGKWAWQSATELRFTPGPGTIEVGTELWIQVQGTLPIQADAPPLPVALERRFRVESFQMGSKVGSALVNKGHPRFVSFLDSATRLIGQGPLYLLYDQPIDPQAIVNNLNVVALGTPLSIRARHPAVLPFDTLGVYDTNQVVAVTIAGLPDDGATVEVTYPVLPADADPSPSKASFTVATKFNWDSPAFDELKSGKAARLISDWNLSLEGPFSPEMFERAFSITPRPPVLQISFGWGEASVRIHAEFDVGRVYSLKVDPTFQDLVGNPLGSPPAFTFKSQDLPPALDVPSNALLLEKGSNRLPLKFLNVKGLVVESRLVKDVREFIRGLSGQGVPSGATLPDVKVNQTENNLNATYQIDVGMGTQPGLKVVTVRGQGRGSESSGDLSKTILVQSTNLGISAKVSDGEVFVWVTRLDDTTPVIGAKVQLFDSLGGWLAEGTTAQDGTVRVSSTRANGSQLDEPLYVSASLTEDTSLCRLSSTEMSGAWQYNLPGAVKGSYPLYAALFTERGAYRPGEAVHFKTWIRNLPEYRGWSTASLLVRDPRGKEAFRNDQPLDSYRGAAWNYSLPANAPVGVYSIVLSLGSFVKTETFRVEEYRVPTFQVAVTSPDSLWSLDQNVNLQASATYLKGGVLSGKPVAWRVFRQPEEFSVDAFSGYRFTLDRDLTASGTVSNDELNLDSQGRSSLRFLPSHPDDWGPMRYIVQASVTDDDRQNYAGQISKVVHATDLYVGARPPAKSVFRNGETLRFPVVVVDTEGSPVAGKDVTVHLDALSWNESTLLDDAGHANTYSREVRSTRELATIKSGLLPQDFSWKLESPGAYRIRLTVKDRGGHTASSDFGVSVSGDASVAWPRFDRERIDLVLDKKSYKIGDTAVLLPQSPFPEARGLLTVESNGVLDTYPFEVKGNTPSISFPVKASYAPNAYVSVILIRGRTHYSKDATGFETGAPAYRLGYVNMVVDPAAQKLAITFDSPQQTARPGQLASVGFSVANAVGQPGEASAAVMVVDEAVLGLTGYKTPDPVALAYAYRVLAVRNASNLLDLPHSRRARYEALFPGGDSDGSDALSAPDDVLRKLFKSTAFFAPAIPVDTTGHATVSFKLPDNLTTYRVMVVAANRLGQMGSSQSALLTRKSLSVEALAPRFVYQGDELTVQARVFNGTMSDGRAAVTAQFTGVTVVKAPDDPSVTVARDGSATVDYRVKVGELAKGATLRFGVTLGSSKDSIEIPLPVRPRGTRVQTLVKQTVSGVSDVQLTLPAGHSNDSLEITLSGTPLSELKDAVQYLMGYPNGCIEQTTSTAYPLVVLKDLLPSIGVEVNAADLRAYAEAGVARILSFQTKEGGLSYWPGGTTPHAFATAFGLTCLIEAKKRGYNVSNQALTEMGDFLEKTLASSGPITGEMPHAAMADGDTRALFVMTLGRLGRPQSAYLSQLWAAKKSLTPFGLAFLAIAAKESKADQALVAPIVAALKDASIQSTQEAYYDGTAKGGWSFDSPLRTDAGSLVAFAAVSTDPEMSQKILKGLLNRRRWGLWGNTQENVFGIMGVYQLFASGAASGASPGSQLSVSVGGRKYPVSAFQKSPLNVLTLTIPTEALTVSGDRIPVHVDVPGGGFYLSVRATSDVPVDERLLQSTHAGIDYLQVYETLEGKPIDDAHVPLGSLVKVRMIAHNLKARHYVALESLLPGAFEPLNEAFLTSQTVDLGPPSQEVLAGQGVLSYREMRDHRVAFYADELPEGTFEFDYIARVTTPGVFFKPSSRAEAMYAAEESGTTQGGWVTVQ